MSFGSNRPMPYRFDAVHKNDALTLWSRALAAAILIHVALPDFQEDGWWVAGSLKALGALTLLYRPNLLGFVLCSLGGAVSLFFLRDVLTQSAYLMLVTLVGVAACGKGAKDGIGIVRMLTAATYGVAAFHKLNWSFFDPQISCAKHVIDQLEQHWPVVEAILLDDAPWAFIAIAVEATLAIAIWRKSPWMWPLGIVFHVPLTATLAPAFGAVMLSGYVAATDARFGARLRQDWAQKKWAYCIIGLLFGALLTVFHPGAFRPFLATKLVAAGVLLAWTLHSAIRHQHRPRARRESAWSYAVLMIWMLNGLSPYLGLQYQHSGAMLSNLRIDQGCANHLILGALQPPDPYIRIEDARIGTGQRPGRERVLRQTLWNRAALATMRRNWCIPELRPIRLEGSYGGGHFLINDLCSNNWTVSAPTLATHWPGFQRYQKNLLRRCDAACIH